jgi:16S rRNA (cytidine1402-2'-O)-methyltransferase
MSKGRLFLIPSVIAADTGQQTTTEQVKTAIQSTRFYLAENIREARRFISSLKLGVDISSLNFEQLNKNTPEPAIRNLLQPLFDGENLGVLSDAGCPGIADPGALAVKMAHRNNIRVIPLVGPSSILLALMSSGLNGQSFSFHGYLPIKVAEAIKEIKLLEQQSRKNQQTQIFIETPYRTDKLLQLLVDQLHPATLLTVASDVTGKLEFIRTMTIAGWRKKSRQIGKQPTVFLFLAE